MSVFLTGTYIKQQTVGSFFVITLSVSLVFPACTLLCKTLAFTTAGYGHYCHKATWAYWCLPLKILFPLSECVCDQHAAPLLSIVIGWLQEWCQLCYSVSGLACHQLYIVFMSVWTLRLEALLQSGVSLHWKRLPWMQLFCAFLHFSLICFLYAVLVCTCDFVAQDTRLCYLACVFPCAPQWAVLVPWWCCAGLSSVVDVRRVVVWRRHPEAGVVSPSLPQARCLVWGGMCAGPRESGCSAPGLDLW